MDLSPTALRDLARSDSGKKILRYTMVSVISVVVSEIIFVLCFGLIHWPAVWSQITACSVATIPSYELNRKWAWGKSGRGHLWREVVPFWTLAFIGLAFSTWAADTAEGYVKRHQYGHGTQTGIVALAALAAFGVLWVGKFIIFNKIMFRTHPDDLDPALDGRTGIAL